MKELKIEEVLYRPSLLSIRILEDLQGDAYFSKSWKSEYISLKYQLEHICGLLRCLARIAYFGDPGSFYQRPIRRIVAEVSKVLEKTSKTLVRKGRRRWRCSILCPVRRRCPEAADFEKMDALLGNCLCDMHWLLRVFDIDNIEGGGGITLSIPPFAINDPMIAWIWVYIAYLYAGKISDKVVAANQLASLAKDNDRNKKYIVEEGGIPPLLKLLKENSSIDLQIAAATTLLHLANDEERASAIIRELRVPIIVRVSSTELQILLADLVDTMAQHSPLAKQVFARGNVIRPLLKLSKFSQESI